MLRVGFPKRQHGMEESALKVLMGNIDLSWNELNAFDLPLQVLNLWLWLIVINNYIMIYSTLSMQCIDI